MKAKSLQTETADSRIQSVDEYKRVFRHVLDKRPSGTRQYLARALGKNRSFITQISTPGYKTPIPPRHVHVIFKICHFSRSDRERFLERYRKAHPGRIVDAQPVSTVRTLIIDVPDLGSGNRNAELEKRVRAFTESEAKRLSPND